jgi:hypothetical protein
MWAPSTPDAVNAIWKMTIGFAAFMLGSAASNLRAFWIGSWLGLLPSSLVAISQAAGYPLIGTVWAPAGLFENGNMMGEAAALVAIGLALQGSWLMCAAVMPALLLSLARGALLAVACVAAARSRIALVIIGTGIVLSLFLPLHRDYADTGSMQERFTIWRETVAQFTPFGHGIGSYQVTLPGKIVEHAHNDPLELAFETGIPGAVLALALSVMALMRASKNDRLVLGALGIMAVFGFPLHMPATAFVGAVVAGHASRGWAPVRWRELVRRLEFQQGNAQRGLSHQG